MAERRLIVKSRTFSYEGLFDGKELFKLIRGWFAEQGYDDYLIRKQTEKHVKGKRQVEIDYLPKKKVSDYFEKQINLDITYMNLKKTQVQYKGHKVSLDEGEVEISFTGYLKTDYEGRWEDTPWKYFFRVLMDRFILAPYVARYTSETAEDIKIVYNLIREFLNATKQR